MNIAKSHIDLTNLIVGLFTFVIIIDPPNTYLHLKDLLFVLLFIICVIKYKVDSKLLIPILVCIIVWCSSTIVGYATNEIKDSVFNTGVLKSLLPFVLLGWIKHLNFTNNLLLPCIVISLISIIVVIAMLFLTEYESILYTYFTLDNGLMMIGKRQFLGIPIASAFYRSTPVIIIPLAHISQNILIRKSNKNIIIFTILFLGLFAGGNRACMLSAIGIPIVLYCHHLYKNKKYTTLLVILFTCTVVTIILLFKLLSDTQEESNDIKFGHLYSYITFFNENIWTLLFGQGAGSLFYSSGFGNNTLQTEWSYIEIIRYFGIIGGFFVICIYAYPLFILLKIKDIDAIYLVTGYTFYLVTAGTNPLLLGSTGIIVCLYCYSYIYNTKHYDGAKNCDNSLDLQRR